MHPRMQELRAHLETGRRALLDAVAAVPAPDQQRQPAPGRWSVAEVVEHLWRVERGVAALLRREFDRVRDRLPRETATTSVLAAMNGAAMLDRQRKLQAPPPVVPPDGLDVATGLARLRESRQALLDVVTAADGFAVGAIHAPHPLFGDHDFYQWLAFVGFHEARHAAQVREIGAQLRP